MSESIARHREGREPAPTDTHVLRLATASGRALLTALQAEGRRRPVVALAEAFAASPPARTFDDVVLAVREHPEPLLVFVGEVDAAGLARLGELPALIDEASTRWRPFTWREVEQATERLAQRLRERLGNDRMTASAWVGVPRGGLVVAGLLAYALGLPRDRLGDDPEAWATVVVDDCLLSGVRLREVLATSAAERIVVATLCSHPELRRCVEEAEPRVVACVSGVDLHDHGPALLGSGHTEWRRRWTARVPERYHAALLDLVAFPWSEPELRLWNPTTERVEAHWWLAPPDTCLQHRNAPAALPIQIADDHPAIDRLSPTVVPVTRGTSLELIDTAGGYRVRLSGSAEKLWQAWLHEDAETAIAQLAARYRQPVDRLRADLDALLTGLRARDLLAVDARQ